MQGDITICALDDLKSNNGLMMNISFIVFISFGIVVIYLALTINKKGKCDICNLPIRANGVKIKTKEDCYHVCGRCQKSWRAITHLIQSGSAHEKYDDILIPSRSHHRIYLTNEIGEGLGRGVTVTQFVKSTRQPRGGFINKKELKETVLTDGVVLSENENLHASIVGMAVDYLTRYMLTGDAAKAFDISKKGAAIIRQSDKADRLISEIDELDEKTVIAACKLSGFDVVYRIGPRGFKDVDTIVPDIKTISNIITMVRRSVNFFKTNKIIHYGMTFEGGYTKKISKGDADYMSNGTIWDMKVSKNHITKNHILQIIIYSILSNRCGRYPRVVRVGIYNPRKNSSYVCNLKDLDQTTFNEITKMIGA